MRAAMRFFAVNLIVASAFATLQIGSAEAASFECRETPMMQAAIPLPAVAAKISGEHKLDILAIGSSSTEGIGASSKDKSYPARLQKLLGQSWPNAAISVTNAGIGGETAPQTIARLKRALSERRYDLVIWQVGTNDAVQGGDLTAFEAMVSDGIAAVRQAGSGLVILDPQYFPTVKDPERYRRFVEAIADTARSRSIPVLSRYNTMLDWHRRDANAFAAVLASDGFHMSDTGYDCLARDMAASLLGMTLPGRSHTAQAAQ